MSATCERKAGKPVFSPAPGMLSQGLKVPWTTVPMYNTVMGLAAGAGRLLLVWLGADLLRRYPVEFDGRAPAFGIAGLLQFVTGLHMTLTWPIAFVAPWDNIYFRALLWVIGLTWGIPGAALVLFVAMNFFTHGGLTYNTR